MLDPQIAIPAAFSHVDLDEATREVFLQYWKPFEFGKHELITEAGSIERYVYVVLSGVQVLYLINEKGEKVVMAFSFTGSFSGVYDSFLRQRPSRLFLESLTPSTMMGIHRDDFERSFEQFPIFERWGRLAHQNFMFGRLDREVELLTCTAEERFISFMRRCPAELRKIPQKYIASYLNMTPETFSRLNNSVKW